MNKDTLLIVQNLTLNRSGADILKNINLELRRGEIHVLMGLNGSGKTSVALTLMGSAGYQPDSGRISFEGQDITHASMTERAQMGMTIAWQEPARFEGLPVADYLALGMKVPSRERIEEALGLVSLSPAAYLGRPVNTDLSGGERKRIELASVYTMQPKLAILDEPDSGIDALCLVEIAALVKRMAQENITVLLITHRDELVGVADSASLLCNGEIVRTGNAEELRDYYVERCRPHGDALGQQPWSCEPVGFYERIAAREREE